MLQKIVQIFQYLSQWFIWEWVIFSLLQTGKLLGDWCNYMYILVLEVDVVKMKHEKCIYSKNIKKLQCFKWNNTVENNTAYTWHLLKMVAQMAKTRVIVEEWILSDLSNGYSIIVMVIAVLPEVDL